MATRLEVRRDDIRRTHWQDVAPVALADGGVRVRIGPFALTSNNVTYASLGDVMGYWQFFPTDDPATGCIPAWGFASVAESRCPGVEVGERFYGYFPVADEVVLWPEALNQGGFTDGAEHRRGLHPIYNRYVRCSADPGYDPGLEAQQALLRPLFSTSFLLDDFLYDHGFFGAGAVILSSASSKTAYGTAFCLAHRRGTPDAVRIVGLTSPGNLDFTRSLGCYDNVVTYDAFDAASVDGPAVYVDFSSDASVRAAVHRGLGERLTYSCLVGGTHWDAPGGDDELPGPAPVLFFVPDHAAKRSAEWGSDELSARIATAWLAFMEPITRADDPWLTVVTGQGRAAVEACYADLLDGRVPAREGHVLSV